MSNEQKKSALKPSVFDPSRLAPFMGPAIVEVYVSFIESIESLAESITKGLSENDNEGLVFCIHRLKGSSGNVGANQLLELATKLEASARSSNHKEISDRLLLLLKTIKETKFVIITYLDQLPETQKSAKPQQKLNEESVVYAVDDDHSAASYLKILVNEIGYPCVTTSDPLKFWDNFPKNCKVVLLDRMMPNLDGLSLLRQIREKYPTQDLPVIMNAELQTIQSMIVTYNHEINNPLTVAFAMLEKLERGNLDEVGVGKMRHHLERIKAIVAKIKGIGKTEKIETQEYAEGKKFYKVS